MGRLVPLFASLFIVGLAELGDKTQVLVLALASKYPMEKVIYGLVAATAVLMLIAVALGEALHSFIHPIFISILSGGFFIIYGLMLIRPVDGAREEKEDKAVKTKDAFYTVFASFFLAELGDKTQLATFALAAKYHSAAMVWLGASAGMIIVNLFGIAIGNMLGNFLPARIINYLTGVIFIIYGAVIFITMMIRV